MSKPVGDRDFLSNVVQLSKKKKLVVGHHEQSVVKVLVHALCAC